MCSFCGAQFTHHATQWLLLFRRVKWRSPPYYRPPTKLREANAFSRVCQSMILSMVKSLLYRALTPFCTQLQPRAPLFTRLRPWTCSKPFNLGHRHQPRNIEVPTRSKVKVLSGSQFILLYLLYTCIFNQFTRYFYNFKASIIETFVVILLIYC